MKTRELFDAARERKDRFGLRARLVLFVALETTVSILIALGIDLLLDRVIQPSREIPLILELIGISLLIGLLITGWLSKYFFAPTKKLREAMGRVADGDLNVELRSRSRLKEIQELFSGFNLMTHELRATEILQMDFLSNASHELKTPISAIEGYAALLRSCDDLTAEQREWVEKIIFNTKRLSSLTGSILLLSKLENQEIPTNRTRFSLDEQIRQSIVALEPRWAKKQIELDVDLCAADYYGSELLLRHVWDNLIGNAVKFTPEGSTVTLRLTAAGDRIVFTVDDQGPGIPEEALRHIFDKFYQADTAHRQEGNGLGLALVEKILELEKGTVEAEALPEGGCRFTVTLRRDTGT